MKFTIRDLIWLTLLAAMGCAWWIERRQLKHDSGGISGVHKKPREVLAKHTRGATQQDGTDCCFAGNSGTRRISQYALRTKLPRRRRACYQWRAPTTRDQLSLLA